MTVLDASGALELLLGRASEEQVLGAAPLRAPHLLDAEVTQGVRRHVRHGQLTAAAGRVLLDDLADLPIERFPHVPLLDGVWRLRDTVSAYDGFYVVLARLLDETLLTADRPLARAARQLVRVELVV